MPRSAVRTSSPPDARLRHRSAQLATWPHVRRSSRPSHEVCPARVDDRTETGYGAAGDLDGASRPPAREHLNHGRPARRAGGQPGSPRPSPPWEPPCRPASKVCSTLSRTRLAIAELREFIAASVVVEHRSGPASLAENRPPAWSARRWGRCPDGGDEQRRDAAARSPSAESDLSAVSSPNHFACS